MALTEESAGEAAAEMEACHPLLARAGQSVNVRKMRKRLVREVRRAIDDYAMVRDGARWLVCLSGGKDSYSLLALLLDLKWRGLLPVDLIACNLDQGQPGFPKETLPAFLEAHGIAHHIEYRDTYSIVTDKVPANATYCALCSRLRRGHLYRIAREKGCDAIVLGHHADDILETFFLNLFHSGRLAAIPPSFSTRTATLRCSGHSHSAPRQTYSASPPRWISRSYLATCAAPRKACSGRRSRPCSASGSARCRGASA
jgi:tRNA 2-thiocytidine biosynthesis protein TtcA